MGTWLIAVGWMGNGMVEEWLDGLVGVQCDDGWWMNGKWGMDA